MKVALVCDWFRPRVGGIELHLHDLAARLIAANHDVVVITPTPGPDVDDGVRTVRIAGRLAPHFRFLMAPAGIRAIGRALAREHVDVAHCHVSIVSPAALGGAAEAQRQGVPTVLTFHSVVPQMRVLAAAARVALRTDRWTACFTAVSHRVARDVQPMAGRAPIRVLPNGVDVEFWRGASAWELTPGARRLANAQTEQSRDLELISVLRLNAKKRPLALIGVMQRVVRSHPGRRIRLTVVGDGPERAALDRRIRQHGLSDHIVRLGARSRAEIRDLLFASDVFVLPAVRESFGLAALEARCAGLPVVAMRSSGVSEIVEHDREGLLAESDAELADHIIALARDDGRRCRLAAHNRDNPPPVDWPIVIDQHLAIYRDAIALRESARDPNAR
ncbi:MAG TPA: glycosyltransferase family 4 protein [Gemmatimonadaceae bacterium]|nr:glycosyltransferase family 4 protein [Gemmatimonadaceae bacterium]